MDKTDKDELTVSLIWVVISFILTVLGIAAFILWKSKIVLFVTIALIMILIFWIYVFRWKIKEVKSKLSKNHDEFKD